MYILVRFSDGSNPWYSINPTKKQAIKYGYYFRKKYGDKAVIFYGSANTKKELTHDANGVWFVRYNNKAKTYKRLGDALNFLLKEEGSA